MPSYAYPPPPASQPPTPIPALDEAVARVAASKDRWVQRSLADRVADLDRIADALEAQAPAMVAAANQSKGLSPDHPCYDEDWQTLAWATMRNLVGLRRRLVALRDGKPPILGAGRAHTRPTGQLVVPVLPETLWDRLSLLGFSGEVWMQPGVTADNLADHTAAHLRRPHSGKTALVLGAGNVGSIPLMDALYKLFVEDEVVVLKMNPVNEYLGPFVREVFGGLVADGFFEVVYGGAEVGHHLCTHPLVDTIHITGSDATYDAIVWGPAEGRAERKAKGERVNPRPVSAELGNVTPIVVVPGQWSARDIEVQAWNIAGMVTNNASFNCVAGKLLVLPAGWAQRDALLARLREVLASIPPRKAYYPGARDRWAAFLEAHPDATALVEDREQTVPWTLITGLDASADTEVCFSREPFCALLSVVELPGEAAVDFLPAAVDFCNERVWGTLACSVIIHPSSRKDSANEAAFQEALDELRYGNIAVNHWPGINYGMSTLTWGAFPGHTPEDIQSGAGVVHNSYLFDKPQKSVLYGPFSPFPKPVWNPNHRKGGAVGRRMVTFERHPGPLTFLGVLWDALTG